MAHIHAFAGIRYAHSLAGDFSKLIAPPYDILDEQSKQKLQDKHPNNIVHVDLPHMPPKTPGPDSAYAASALTLETWLASGALAQDPRPCLYPYTQVYQHNGHTFRRRGVIALVRLSHFGEGEVVPHEKTFQGAIEDRFKLMSATQMQLSPIFGLFADPRNEVTSLLYQNLAKPDFSGELDGVTNDLWHISDPQILNAVTDLMKQRPIYIADGHHRYTTALHYQRAMAHENGGPLPPEHPANYCMFVLVGMQEPGLLILPTHRMLGGLSGFDIPKLKMAFGATMSIEPSSATDPVKFAELIAHAPPHTFGLYDGLSRRYYALRLANTNVLEDIEPRQSQTWRELDVAILQRYLIDEVIKPTFCGGIDPSRGYTADPATIPTCVDGGRYQISILLQPTPLHALEQLGKHNEVMPQKSTYFYPKLATGMVINSLKAP